jgi:chemotaxis protein MotB
VARKKPQQEHENHERWLVSYADFITLLFAFFVVMYSLSSVNEGKYRILSESLQAAFRAPTKALEPIQVGDIARSPFDIPKEFRNTPQALDISFVLESSIERDPNWKTKQTVKSMVKQLEKAMSSLIDEDLVSIRADELWVEVEIKTSILFPSGSAQLDSQAVPVLRRLADIIKNYPNRIHVEGFTDNVPINTRIFPSNWELSAARAATVVRIFSQDGVEPARMVAIGYGEYRPKADNSTPHGRSKNRRVVVTILADVDKANNNQLLLTLSDRATKELMQQVNDRPSEARRRTAGQAKETLQKTKLERDVSSHSVSPNG